MPVRLLGSHLDFPAPREAEPSGLLAVGGDLSPERLLRAYSEGIFPWYSEGDPILWFSPDPRLVLRPHELRASRNLRRAARQRGYDLALDTAFDRVIRSCATVVRPREDGTWITSDMIQAYCRLHELGYAHAAEAWHEGELVGGIYGVSLGGAFFGESMFTFRPDASKLAFAALVLQLGAWGHDFVDCQVHTPHLVRLGARMWSRSCFLRRLASSLEKPTRRGAWRFDGEVIGDGLSRTLDAFRSSACPQAAKEVEG